MSPGSVLAHAWRRYPRTWQKTFVFVILAGAIDLLMSGSELPTAREAIVMSARPLLFSLPLAGLVAVVMSVGVVMGVEQPDDTREPH